MADALISPAVGGALWAASAGWMAWCAKKVRETRDDRLIPMMGVLGAFLFTAQMINFSIPGTGSSGHLGGGLLLAILLGPHAAFLVMASVLTVQAFFFADGGLLALGCNLFNLGFFPAFIAYPLLYRPLAQGKGGRRDWAATLLAAIAGLQMGAFGVVLETTASGISSVPFGTFVLLMQPIHLAIGVVEGLATVAIVGFIASARPEALLASPSPAHKSLRPVLAGVLVAALLTGGALSWFACKHPDGLEWALARVTGKPELEPAQDTAHAQAARIQEKTAFLPDYGFQPTEPKSEAPQPKAWPEVNAGTSLSGLLGGAITLTVAGLIGYSLKPRRIST